MKSRIITKIGIALLLMSSLIFIVAVVDRVFNSKIAESTEQLSQEILPRAILSLSILDEIGDMNANILEYLSGEEEEMQDFSGNLHELREMLDKMQLLPGADRTKLREIDILVKDYEKRVRVDVFGAYNPAKEREARRAVKGLTEKTGKPLEQLLDMLKESEVADAGKVEDLKIILEDDLPGVQYYLELVDEAGDMISDLNSYISSENPEEDRNSFSYNALSFKEYFERLRPIELDSIGIRDLNRVELLFTILYTSGIGIMNEYDPTTKVKALLSVDELEHDIFRDLEKILDAYSESATVDSRQQIDKLIGITRFNEQMLWGVLVLVFFVGVGITYLTYSTVLRPISELNKNILQLSEGDSDIEIFGITRNDEIGELAGAVMKFKESSELRAKMERQLIEEKKKAEEATKYKSDFLANMSHEIRTPMNAITGLLSLVLKTELTNKQYSYLRKINTSAKNLLGILNDILDFSKIEAGKMAIENSRFNFNEVLQNLSVFMMEKNDDKELELIYNISPDVPFDVSGDSLRLGQVLLNLTSNAMKFTSRGELIISISVLSREDDNVRLFFEVKDTGIGIEQVVLDTIFQPFVQADHSHTRRFGGTGLGLAITRQLVELMGGELHVESEVGKGTRFYFTLPFKYYNEEEPFIAEHINEMAGQRILVADSNANSRRIIGRLLDSLKMAPSTVESGLEAIKLYNDSLESSSPFNIVMFDWNLQDIPCTDAAEKISESRVDGDTSILFSTSSARESVINRLDSFNNEGILLKPYSRSTLFDAIVEAIGKESMIRDYNRRRISDSMESLDAFAGSQILVAEDNEINREVINDILKDMKMNVILVEDGEKAVDYLKSPASVDLVLMDIQMPRMDGLEASREIRNMIHRKDTPIIALTAHALLSQKRQCLEAGMNDHISKPIEYRELVQKLSRWLPVRAVSGEKQNLLHDHTEVVQKGIFDPLLDSGIDFVSGIERFGGSEKLFLKVLKKFAGEQGRLMILKLTEAAEDGDFNSVSHAAHSLKGVSGTVGAVEIYRLATKAEESYADGIENEELIVQIKTKYQQISETINDVYPSENNSPSESPITGIQNEKFNENIKSAITLVEKMDVGSYAFFQDKFAGLIDETKFNIISKYLEEYEFDKALGLLNEMKNVMSDEDE